jgi:endo-1,4-beta-xylanase
LNKTATLLNIDSNSRIVQSHDQRDLEKVRQLASTLDAAMKKAGRSYIGTSLTIRSDNNEQSITKSDFGSITPENAMKFDATEPNRGQFSLSGADQYSSWASSNGKQLRCHTLVWYSQLPGWVSSGNFNNQTLISIMQNHITTLVTRYKGKCTHWDVVNEGKCHDIQTRSNYP